MKEIKCDVLVVGAGPAGSSAAWSATKEGLNVIIIDKKKIPAKDACAETLSKALLELLPFKIPKKFLKWELDGLQFNYENIHITKDKDIWWNSYPLNRSEFDPFVLDLAINKGAHYLSLSEFINLKFNKEFIVNEVSVRNLKNTELMTIKPKILIAADGVQSKVLKSIGKSKRQKTSVGYIKSYEYHNLSLDNPHYGHVFFGKFADGAYAYIFPKSETSANIGIATMCHQGLDKKFNKFIELIKDQIKGSKRVVDRSGRAPLKNPSDEMVYGNIIFTGDAANQNLKPFVEGIQPGIICGSFAGKSAVECISNIKKLKFTYKNKIKEKMGQLFADSDTIGTALISSYENKNKARFLLEMGLFSYCLNDQDLKKIEKLSDSESKLFIKEKLKLKI
jgi:digeranylgeranylglycerophospholipid reductase